MIQAEAIPIEREQARASGGFGHAILVTGAAVLAAGAAAALWNWRQAKQDERRHPPLGRFVEAQGVRLHYLDEGSGPPVVLLHGNGAMIEDFLASGLLQRLARRHRVIAFDRPGFGHSERPRRRMWTPAAQAACLAEAFAHLGIERPVILGHSYGTLVALALALDHPDRVHALALLSGYYFPTARPDIPVAAVPAIPLLGDALRYTLVPLATRFLFKDMLARTLFAPRPVPRRFTAEFPLAMSLRPWQIRASAADAAFQIPATAMRERYGELRLPIVIIAGAEDRVIDTARQSVRLHRAIPGSRLLVLPGLGHMVHYFAEEEIAGAVDHLSELVPAAAERERLLSG